MLDLQDDSDQAEEPAGSLGIREVLTRPGLQR